MNWERLLNVNIKITIPKADLDSIEEKSKLTAFTTKGVYDDRDVDVWDVLGFGIPRLFRENKIKVGEEKVYDEEVHISKHS